MRTADPPRLRPYDLAVAMYSASDREVVGVEDGARFAHGIGVHLGFHCSREQLAFAVQSLGHATVRAILVQGCRKDGGALDYAQRMTDLFIHRALPDANDAVIEQEVHRVRAWWPSLDPAEQALHVRQRIIYRGFMPSMARIDEHVRLLVVRQDVEAEVLARVPRQHHSYAQALIARMWREKVERRVSARHAALRLVRARSEKHAPVNTVQQPSRRAPVARARAHISGMRARPAGRRRSANTRAPVSVGSDPPESGEPPGKALPKGVERHVQRGPSDPERVYLGRSYGHRRSNLSHDAEHGTSAAGLGGGAA